MEYVQKAADQGIAEAVTSLGDFYYLGAGVEQDYEKAAEYYRQAAELGDEEAAERLKTMTEEGQIKEK
jgi:hypothetical protein